MYAWEKPFAKLIAHARKLELNIVRKNSYVRALYMTFLLFTTRMAIFSTMFSIVLMSGSEELTASKVFVIAAYFNIVASTMSQMFVRGVAEIAEALVAFRRLQNFLEYEEKDLCRLEYLKIASIGLELKDDRKSDRNAIGENAVLIKNATARWIPLHKTDEQKDNKKTDNWQKGHKNGAVNKKMENETQENPTLDSVNIDFKKGTLIGIVGPVGL